MRTKRWLKPLLFTIGGALVGLAYYTFVGCKNGTCFIASDPIVSMIYMGVIGWLLSGIFSKECSCNSGCNTGCNSEIEKKDE